MRLHRLRVWNFGAVRDIDVEFGPGLNVLYGPNDLGKSTLVDAIRLVLLLPHTSAYCEQFVPWTGAFNPTIELTFETEAQRIWRVKKEFGRAGSSLLQESRDGRDFEDVARARSVDAQLRQILQWGIAEPGGSGGAKGLPASFLCTALLSTQSNVSAMLRDSLEIDSASSGKERIETALQAVAQDPMFMALLRYVQQCRDSAYTPTGNKKTSKDSVFKTAAERLNMAREEKEKLHQIVVDSQGTEKTLRDLIDKRAARHEALDAANEEVAALERMASQASAQSVAASEVRLAEDELTRIQKIETDVRAAARTLVDLARNVADADRVLESARRESDEARQALTSAEEAARAEGSDPEIADTLVRQQLELRKLEADKSAAAAQQTLQAATEAVGLVKAAAAAEHEYEAQCLAADRARVAYSDAAGKETAFSDALGHCDILERALELETAIKRAETAKADVEREGALHKRLETLKGERDALVKQRAGFTLPAQTQFAAMRRLATDLGVARGALEVGLTVTVSPGSPLSVDVRQDGSASLTTTVTRPMEIEANTEVEIAIPNIATFLVRGGRREAQQNMRLLEDRWNREAVPHLQAAGAADLEELERKIAEARDLDNSIHSLDIEIESLGPQLRALAGVADVFKESSQHFAACKAALGNQSAEAASRDLKTLGANPLPGLRKKRQQVSADLESARKNARDAASSLILADERARTSKLAFEETVRGRDAVMTGFPDGIKTVVEAAQAALATANTESEYVDAEIASLENTIKARKERVVLAVAGARKTAEAAESTLRQVEDRLTKARTEHAQQSGRIEQLRKMREAENLEAAEAALKVAKDRLAALPVPDRFVAEAELVDARKKVEGMALALKMLDSEIQRAHGALAQVGGAVARERLTDAVEAFELAERQEKEVEEEYEAWKLLLEQMKEAEKAQASNLGQALAPAIAGRFQILTGQRYENLQLTPQLRTEGVLVSGTLRSTERISVGTREQLSTLYRLCLAEYLQTVLVLDDQLVQSDEMRMDWFRSLLKEKCRAFQILVFTCRPRDYLDKKAMVPKGNEICLDTEAGFTRAVDLGRVLVR